MSGHLSAGAEHRHPAGADPTAPGPMPEQERWTKNGPALSELQTVRDWDMQANHYSPLCQVYERGVPPDSRAKRRGLRLHAVNKISPQCENLLRFTEGIVQMTNTTMTSLLVIIFLLLDDFRVNSWGLLS